jgi:Carboxypeptidase regulatory-like domain
MLPSGLLALLALILWTFWKYVGGAGGFFLGEGVGTDTRETAASRPTGIEADRDSTVRRAFAQVPRSPASPAESRPPMRATATVKPKAGASAEWKEVIVRLDQAGAAPGSRQVEVLQGPGNGTFTVKMEAGEATIPAVRQGEQLTLKILEDGAPVAAGELVVDEGEHALDLRKKARITGRAEFSDGAPPGDRELDARIFRAGHPAVDLAFRTRADGTIDLEAPPGIDLLLELRPKGAAAGSDLGAVVFQRAVLETGDLWELGPIAFEPQVVLAEGVVEDARGAPAAGASVQLLPIKLPTRQLGARTDAAGRFVVRGPAVAAIFDVFAATESEAARLDAAVKGATGLKLVLAPAGRIRGTAASPTPALNPLLRVELQTANNNVFTTTPVLPDGSFELLHVPAGRWTLVIAAPDSPPAPLEGIEVPAGGPSADARLAAVPVKTNLVPASLKVIDSSGAPVPEAVVELKFGQTRSLRTTTDASGSASVVARPDATVPLTVEAPGFPRLREPWDGKQAVVLKK